MKKTARQMIDALNEQLARHQQLTRVTHWTSNSLTLATGLTLAGNEKKRFVRRVANSKTSMWVNNIDCLINGEISDREIKSMLSAAGGKACQLKHGKRIRKNLNTGIPWSKGLKGKYPYNSGPIPQEVKDKISKANSGPKNGMYGVRMSESDKKIRSESMKQKILSGEFTPNSNNRNTHWNSTFDGMQYRSSWEALYQFINQSAEYEALRIEYNFANSRKIYIVDFIDHINNVVVEVKPRELCVGEKFNAKIQALTSWANSNNYSVLIVTKEWLQEQTVVIDYDRFDNNTASKIKALYETNQKNRN